MSIVAKHIIKEASFGAKIKVILTEILCPNNASLQRKSSFIVHYLEKDKEPLEYAHKKEDKALDDFHFLSKIAKKEIRQSARANNVKMG